MKCSMCGKFTNADEAKVKFTPDSEYTIEKIEWICKSCSDK